MPRRSLHSSHYGQAPDDAPAWGRHVRWLGRARELAVRSQHPTRMGALAVTGGRVIAEGVNQRRNTPRLVDWPDCSRHAEAVLVRRADLAGATVYVARVLRGGDDGMARPCRYCLGQLIEAGVRQVVWTAGPGATGVERIHRQ